MHVLLIGLGNMGRKYLKKIKELGLKPVLCDIDPEKANVCNECPFYCHIGDVKEDVQKVIIAVDPKDHVKLAREFLEKGIPVLLEKPPALTSKEFEEISGDPNLEISEIELYSEAVKNFPANVEPEEIIIERLNRGSGYINPLWDLAWHDLYILQYLFGEVEAEEVNKKEGVWELKGKVRNAPFTLRVAWKYPKDQRRIWRIKTNNGDILMDFVKEELVYGNYTRYRLYGDKLGEMVSDFLKGVRREGSTKRALNNLKILESLKV
ncbi:MAG: gfo/Idh/MocA family oxidoreductase [Aquifex sp.]|nr:MAG: gfo/Idh/MocA family oxidoreductase [Aquifex sp.]